MRGIKAMLWEPSVLDSEEGIRFWGRTIPECQAVLPTAPDGKEMLPEAMFWYLLTSKVPTAEETIAFQHDLASRAELPAYLEKIIDALRACLLLSAFGATANSLGRRSHHSSPHDPVRHCHRRPQPRLQVRRRLHQGNEEGRVLAAHPRGLARLRRQVLHRCRPFVTVLSFSANTN